MLPLENVGDTIFAFERFAIRYSFYYRAIVRDGRLPQDHDAVLVVSTRIDMGDGGRFIDRQNLLLRHDRSVRIRVKERWGI